MPKRQYRFIDLFAGIGGFHAALDATGRAECVFASEWDDSARKTYAANFPVRLEGAPDATGFPLLAGDITKIAPADIPAFDILCGGFPCQPFSQAGLKKGFNETRGTLFFNIEEILRVKQPAAFFLENVRGLINHDGGRTLATITERLHALGYHAPGGAKTFHHLVKASDYGLPQHRPRVFLVGFRDPAVAAKFEFPKKQPLAFTMSDLLGGRVTTDAVSDKERTIGYTLRCGGCNSGVGDRRNWDCYLVNGKERRITVAEATKLQGFPEKFDFPRTVAKTQAYKQLGNSVAVPAIHAWAKAIIRALSSK